MKSETNRMAQLLALMDRKALTDLPVPAEEAVREFEALNEQYARVCGALGENGQWDEDAYDEDEAFEAILFELEEKWALSDESVDLRVAQALNEYMDALDEAGRRQ